MTVDLGDGLTRLGVERDGHVEHPMVFTGWSVRAILEGRKTMTRRVVADSTSQGCLPASCLLLDDPRAFVDGGPSPLGNPGPYLHVPVNVDAMAERYGNDRDEYDDTCVHRLYPRWFPGDRLWVREAWAPFEAPEGSPAVAYRATCDGEFTVVDGGSVAVYTIERWRPSIFMPRWACRLVLEVTEVRCERLTEISEDDCFAEGMEVRPATMQDADPSDRFVLGAHESECPFECFAMAWDAINAKRGYPWDSDPRVWAISYRVVEP